MDKDRWNEIKQFYVDSFGISPELVDLLADNDIITMCVSGSSNDSISISLDIDRKTIDDITLSILDFTGWKYDMSINPLSIYNDLAFIKNKGGYPLFKEFDDVVTKKDPSIGEKDRKTMFRLCKLYDSISSRLDKGWV
jgi:hypothetical protein